MDCLLCCEEREVFSYGKCSHYNICYVCTYKMRIKSQNIKCAICNTELEHVLMCQEQPDNWNKINLNEYNYDEGGIYFESDEVESICKAIDEYKCPIKSCKEKTKGFPSLVLLKKHLKKSHNRVYCDVCVNSNMSILREQKLFKPGDLREHLRRGDYDNEGNLIFLHPFCKFCNKNFYNEDEFNAHIKQSHEKCTLCGPNHSNVVYQNYQELAIHFEKSHFACRDEECKLKGFIAFKHKHQLDDHLFKVHGYGENTRVIVTSKEEDDGNNELKDNIGIDMTRQFLSLRKHRHVHYEDDSHFDDTFDIRIFLKHRRDKAEAPSKQGGNKRRNNNNNTGYPYLEEIKIVDLKKLHHLDFEEFSYKCKKVIDNKFFEKLRKKTGLYKKGVIKPGELFDDFCKYFGNINAYEFFAYFIKTVTNKNSSKELKQELRYQVNYLRSKTNSILCRNKTYSEFFQKFTKEISKNIIDRYQNNIITHKTSLKKNQMQLSRFFGTIKKIFLAEIVELTFLSQFFEDVESLEILQNALFVDYKLLQQELSKIHDKDIILCFLYFNLSHNRLIGKNVGLTKRKVNPNLGKLFLRHFKHFADDHHFKIDSDDEDYIPEVVKKTQNGEEKITLGNIGNFMKKGKKKILGKKHENKDYTKNIHDVFVTHHEEDPHNIKEEDLKNKFDFPQINEDLTCDLPKRDEDQEIEIALRKKKSKKKTVSNGWDNDEMYIYKSKDMSKKEMNSLFPTLGGAMGKKKPSPVAAPPVQRKPGKSKNLGNFGNYQEEKNDEFPDALNGNTASKFFF